jgi:hypothetical protein
MNWDLAALVDGTLMSFDAADKRNGSLYICDPSKGSNADGLIAALRKEGLWSAAEPKRIAEEQKDAYKSGLQFNEAREYTIGGKTLVLLRCDHPKFPSDAARWQEWNRVAGELCA